MILLRYIYYRMAHALMNYGWDKEFSHYFAYTNTGGNIFCILMSIVLILVYLTIGPIKTDGSKATYFIVGLPCWLLSIHLMNDKVKPIEDDDKYYQELDLKYKHEKHRIIKGCLVFLYCLISLIVCVGLIIFVLIIPSE